MFLLKNIQERYLKEVKDESVAFVFLNVKGRDLLAIDKPNEELPENDKKMYEELGLETKPFDNVKYFYPYSKDIKPTTYADIKDVKSQQKLKKAFQYKYLFEDDKESLDLLFANIDDPTQTMESIVSFITSGEGTFSGITNWEDLREEIKKYQEKGGFPEFLKTGNEDILTQLQSDILYRDIAVRYGIRDVASLRRLFVYLISNPAQLFSPSKLTGIVGVKSPTTVLEYISFFEAAYLVHLLPCFAWSVKAQSLAPKKVYVADTGIIKTGAVSFSDNLGALLENFVFNCLRTRTRNTNQFQDREIYYFSAKNGGECDFIVSPHTKPCCIQVCWELTHDKQDREINGLLNAMIFFNLDVGTIITFDSEDIIQTAGKTITVIPAWKFKTFFEGE
jgi:predicted AAA+ superfamily ATPase